MFTRRPYFPFIASSVCGAIALSTLVGWALDIPELRSLRPGLPGMVPMTAVNVLLLSAAVFFLTLHFRLGRRNLSYKMFAAMASAGALTLGLVTIVDHVFGIDTGLGGFFFAHSVTLDANVLYDGKMSLQTSSMLVFLGTVLFSRPFRGSGGKNVFFQILPVITIMLCLLGIIGYIHRLSQFGPSKWIGISVPTGVAMILISAAALSLEDDVGFMKRLRSSRADGYFLRRYAVFSVLAPILIAFLISCGEALNLYPTAFSSSLFVLITIASFCGLGIFIAGSVRRIEDQRLEIEQARSREALRESEESLKEANERLALALEASRMGTWEADLTKRMVSCSETTERILGITQGVGRWPFSFLIERIHPEDRDRFIEIRDQAVERRSDLDIDFRCLSPGGQMRWLRCKGRIKFTEHGEALHIGGTIADIHAEKMHQETLEAALRAAESASRLKTAFLANMSHEIRTPLGAILGFTDLLADPESKPADKARYLEIISRNGKTLSYLLNDILDLSKVESGHLNVERIDVRVREVTDEVISLMGHGALEKGLHLTVRYDEGIPSRIVSDPLRIKQILMNLIGNAIKFTSAGGVSVRVRSSDRMIFFDIEDSGIGIESEKKERLFQAFSQADDSTTRRFGGTGLGLVLSRKLAVLLGGSVELVRSEPSRGSLFTVSVSTAL